MAQAKWYRMTPARQQLLIALVLAVLALGAIFGTQLDCVAALRDAGKKAEPANGAER